MDNSTDQIISVYENKLSQNIAAKTISASKRGENPDFTKEELLYLNKKACELDDSELNVITPPPVITLKKGKTELNIRHAAALVQKMEEKYPTGTGIVSSKENILPPYHEEQADYTIHQIQKEEPLKIPGGFEQPIKTMNKNAYEIREAVLSHALGWVQYTHEFKSFPKSAPTEDDVLNVAQKFYKFVENRK